MNIHEYQIWKMLLSRTDRSVIFSVVKPMKIYHTIKYMMISEVFFKIYSDLVSYYDEICPKRYYLDMAY